LKIFKYNSESLDERKLGEIEEGTVEKVSGYFSEV
jgi:hypothetical protein